MLGQKGSRFQLDGRDGSKGSKTCTLLTFLEEDLYFLYLTRSSRAIIPSTPVGEVGGGRTLDSSTTTLDESTVIPLERGHFRGSLQTMASPEGRHQQENKVRSEHNDIYKQIRKTSNNLPTAASTVLSVGGMVPIFVRSLAVKGRIFFEQWKDYKIFCLSNIRRQQNCSISRQQVMRCELTFFTSRTLQSNKLEVINILIRKDISQNKCIYTCSQINFAKGHCPHKTSCRIPTNYLYTRFYWDS